MTPLRRFSEWSALRIRGQPLFVAALAAGLGIVLGDWLGHPGHWLALLVPVAVITLFRSEIPWLMASVVLGFAATHAFQIAGQEAFPSLATIRGERPQGVTVIAEGSVADEPVSSETLHRFPFLLTSLTLDQRRFECRRRILVTTVKARPAYGQQLRLLGSLAQPDTARNPGEFDYRRHLWREGVPVQLHVSHRGRQEVLAEFVGSRCKRASIHAREWIRRAVTSDLPPDDPATVTLEAMILGIQHQIPLEVEDAFRHSGTLHLFSVSGLHVSMIAACLWFLASPLGLSRSGMVALVAPLMFGYAFITGWQPPAVRSAIMAAVFLFAYVVDRQARSYNSLGAAAFLVLAMDTNEWFQPSFQLSFGIVLAMIALTNPLFRPAARLIEPDPFLPKSLISRPRRIVHRGASVVLGSIAVSLAATIGSLPLVLGHFRLVTPSGILANSLVVPLSFPVLFSALAAVACALLPFLGWASLLFNNANFGLAKALVWIAQSFSALPGGHAYVSLRPEFIRAPCEVTVLDLPRGGGLSHVAFHGGIHQLIDTGHVRDHPVITRPYLRQHGVNRLDALWLTHADAAHVGAAPNILAENRPRALLQSTWEGRGPSITALRLALFQNTPEEVRVHAGSRIPVNDFARWEVLYPPEDGRFRPNGADNQCLVARLHAGPWRVIFVADSGFVTERRLLSDVPDLAADILIKGNHRDDISGSPEFLAAVDPALIIADLEDNPEPAWLAWARNRGVSVFDQRETGAVRVELRPEECRVSGFLVGREFRQRFVDREADAQRRKKS